MNRIELHIQPILPIIMGDADLCTVGKYTALPFFGVWIMEQVRTLPR